MVRDMERGSLRRLAVIPSDSMESWEKAGYLSWLPEYFNPQGLFDQTFLISPLEEGQRDEYGLTIIGASEREFPAVISDVKPDVIRAYGGCWAPDFLARNRTRDIPTVASVHNTPPSPVRDSLSCMDIVICISEAVREAVLAVGVAPERVRMLGNRVDTEIFRPVDDEDALRKVAARFPEGRHVLYVGRKTRQKNPETLIAALAHLPADYHAVLVGQGSERALVDLAKRLDLSDRCHLVDRVANHDLPVWYSWCDCMCVPSRWEGFGIVFIEAAACGAAIVTSNIAPMNEYLVDGESASLVDDFEDPRELAAALARVCEDEQYRGRLSDGARAVASNYDRSTIERGEAAIYEEAMALAPPDEARWAQIEQWRRRHKVVSRLQKLSPRRIAGGLWRRAQNLAGG